VAGGEQAAVVRRDLAHLETRGTMARRPDKVLDTDSHRTEMAAERGGSSVVPVWCGDGDRWSG
jgi:hypothetical protein